MITNMNNNDEFLSKSWMSDEAHFHLTGDGIVVRVPALQFVNLGFISLVESYQKTLKNGIHSFPAWRSSKQG